MATTFEVLADPRRRQILEALRGGERSVGELVDRVDVSQPGMSKHLKVLREAGFVDVRPDAQRRKYRLRTEPLREIDEWISPYRQMWVDRLDALEQHLETMERDEPMDRHPRR
jgi:DNA-binding transcriptional ArsR family regulator